VAPGTAAIAWRFCAWLRRERIRLVHPFDVPTVIFAVPLGRLARVPVVLSSQRGDRRLFARGAQHALGIADRLADSVIVNSDYVRRILVTEFGARDDRVRTHRNGLDVGVFQPNGRCRRPELRDGGLVVGIVAALRTEKSIHTLIEAFSRLRNATHQLVIVGDGPCKKHLQTQARQMGLGDRCLFVPGTPDVVAWYRSMDVFVLPSLNESFSNSLMEAMACGCAVVASKVGGNPELVRDGENGLLFEPGNVADLASRLEAILLDVECRRRLAAAAVRTIQEEYTIQASARRYAALYEELLERTATSR
jgi:glycosyltransferase involved in cell wall biosynthesis